MKRLNKFSRLPQEDQTLILNLCDKLPYKDVAEQIARPRSEGGLDFTTCVSALCKFNTSYHPDVIATEAIGQYSAAIQINHQAHGEANFEAILSLVQTRILTALRAGKSVADLDREFRNLQRVQKCFLAEVKYRDKNERTQEAYLNHIKLISPGMDEADFIDNTLEDDPGAGGTTAEDFQEEPTQLDLDLDYARTLPAPLVSRYSSFFRAAARIVATRMAAKDKEAFLKVHNISPAFALPELQNPTPESLLALQKKLEAAEIQRRKTQEISREISTQNTSKTPAISTISNNFHSPETKGGVQ
jgi:hypothetical protein